MEVIADKAARVGERNVKVVATDDATHTEQDLKVRVVSPPQELKLALPEEVIVYKNGQNEIKVRTGRFYLTGDVTLRFEGEAPGVSFKRVIIPDEQTEADIEVAAAPETKSGSHMVKVIGTCGTVQGEGSVKVTVTKPGWVHAAVIRSWSTILVVGCWTALLAIGLSLALVMGQNLYLSRPLLGVREALVVLGGGLAAGLFAGCIGQLLFGFLAWAKLPPEIGFFAGWMVLGSLLGLGVSLFIPNLHAERASLAGALGGLLGAGAFLAASETSGDAIGRLLGALSWDAPSA